MIYKGNIFPSLKNNNSNIKKYLISQGDVIKLGRIYLKIKNINLKNTENLQTSFEDSICDIENNNNINKTNNNSNKIVKIQKKNSTKNFFSKIKNFFSLKKTTNNIELNKSNTHIPNENTNNIEKKIQIINIKKKSSIKKNKKKINFCRICYNEEENSLQNPLIRPCKCKGSMKFIHLNCLKHWIKTKKLVKKIDFIKNKENVFVYSIEQIKCELCKEFLPEIIKHKNVVYNLYEFNNEINSIVDEHNDNFIIFETSMIENNNCNYKIVFKFNKNEEILIGRADDCNLIINDITISRIHLKIFFSELSQQLNLIDQNSKFGTLILMQNPKIEIIKNLPLNLQIDKMVFNFLVKDESNFFNCCDANVSEFKTNYGKLNRKFVIKYSMEEFEKNTHFLDEDEIFNDDNNDSYSNSNYNDNDNNNNDNDNNNNNNNDNDNNNENNHNNNNNNNKLNRSNSLTNLYKNNLIKVKIKNYKKFITEKEKLNEEEKMLENNNKLLINKEININENKIIYKKLITPNSIKTNNINEIIYNNNINN